MLLSFVIPYFNGQDTIGKCLDSIYHQGLPTEDFEVIVVNDCSTNPQAVETVKSYIAARKVSNLRLMSTPENRRQGGARNLGVSAAQGTWIAYIDQDDYFTPPPF